ncbi:MAG: BatD family protein [Kofleriaceae bacterium]
MPPSLALLLCLAVTRAHGQPAPGTAGSAGPGASAGSAAPAPPVIQLPPDVAAPRVNASASPTVVRLGDRFTVFVTATYGAGVAVNLREPIELGSGFEVLDRLSEDRTASDGTQTREWQLAVTAWELGELRMAPIAVTFTVGGQVGHVQTNVVKVRVEGVLGDLANHPSAIRDVQPPTRMMVRTWRWLWAAGAGIGAIALIAALLWIRRRRRRRRNAARLIGGAVAAPTHIDLTGERALERLLAIHASGVLDREDDRKRGYTEMVSVIRDYLGGRYQVATLDLTSSELERALARTASADELSIIAAWLEQCDRVKYAGVQATAAQAHRTLDDARALVVTTTELRDHAQRAAA